MFFSRASSIAVALFALSATSTDAANLRSERRLGATYSADSADWKQAMLTAVNEQRANSGLSALCLNSKLTSAAQIHSVDMAANNYMDHNGADGSTMSGRVTAAGFDWSYVAENVAAGQVDVAAVMDSWMNSDGHRANIMSSEITMLGCGYSYDADSEYGHYWTQDFGAGSSEACDGSTSQATTTSYEVAGEADSTQETTAPATEAPTAAPTAQATEAPVPEVQVTDAPATEAPAATSGCKTYF